MKKLKIGFVGVGFMGQRAHLANYTEILECKVTVIAEARETLGHKVAARYGIETVCRNHMELIKKHKPDAIVASQPYKHHINLIPDILNAGIPVFTEKPLSLSVENGKILAALSLKTGTLHMVGYHKRSDPAVEYAKSIIDTWKLSGDFGKMKYIRITMPPGDWKRNTDSVIKTDDVYPDVTMESTVPGFNSDETFKYDTFVNYYIHQVNLMRYLFGESYHLSYADPSGVLLSVQSKSGVCGVIEMATFKNTTDWQESVMVCFEKGYINIDLPAPLAVHTSGKVTIMRDNGVVNPSYEIPILPNISAMRNQAKNFIAAVNGDRPAPCESIEAVEDLKIARDYINMTKQY